MEASGLLSKCHTAGPFAQVSLQQRGEGGREGGSGCCCLALRPSELLQTAIHLSLALFPGPGPALGAELLQVFFKVLVVHGPVTGGLAVRLAGRQDEVRAHLLHTHTPARSLRGAARLCSASSRALLCAGQIPRPLARNTHDHQTSGWRGGHCPPESPSYLAFQEELLISALQDIQLRVVEFGVLVTKPISLSHISAPIKGKESQSMVSSTQ